MNLFLVSASLRQPEWEKCLASWHSRVRMWFDMNILDAYQAAFKTLQGADILGYLHDDLICHEKGWEPRILKEFEDEDVVLVGVAGALGHGQPHMYQESFHIPNMVRIDFRSNMKDAERHGTRLTGASNAAVLDGMAFFVRRSWLESIGGWPIGTPIGYYLYMEWLCCMARRTGKKIRIVGLAVDHLGGKSSGMNPTAHFDFEGEHRWLFENFRDVLPYRVEP